MAKGVIQGRCNISEDVYDQLPETLRQNGSIMFLTKEVTGFCAVYELESKGERGSPSESFLFWGINLEAEERQAAERAAGNDARADFVLEYLRSRNCEEHGLPTIVNLGRHNVRCGAVSSSTPPVDWRKGNRSLGRIIFIGDSIHAMTRECGSRSHATNDSHDRR